MVSKPNPIKEKLFHLMTIKDNLEAKIKQNGNILEANGNIGMHEPLVDSEGFPRTDIDIYQVRQARQQILCHQNDYKKLMKEIEENMHKLHAETAEELQSISNVAANLQLDEKSSSANVVETHITVIIKVNLVSPGSPAEDAGLRVNDEIVEFGTVNSNNFENLNQIGVIVNHMKNQRIPLKVRRQHQLLDLILIPKTWSGRGLLGCNIVLPDAVDR